MARRPLTIQPLPSRLQLTGRTLTATYFATEALMTGPALLRLDRKAAHADGQMARISQVCGHTVRSIRAHERWPTGDFVVHESDNGFAVG